MPQITANRLRSLLAAEAVCQQLRFDVVEAGGMTRRTLPFFDRWLRTSGKTKYQQPKKVYPVWCCDCKCRHVCGEHVS